MAILNFLRVKFTRWRCADLEQKNWCRFELWGSFFCLYQQEILELVLFGISSLCDCDFVMAQESLEEKKRKRT